MSNLRIKYKKLKRDYEALKTMVLPTRIAYVSTYKNVDKITVRKWIDPLYENVGIVKEMMDDEAEKEIGKYAMDNNFIKKEQEGSFITYTAYMVNWSR